MYAPLLRPHQNGPPVVIGHRGAPRMAPENTPASFAAAAAAGATWVEFDVRRGADGLVVSHDPCLPDGTPLVERTRAALRQAGIWPLEEVLDGLPAGLGADLELKNLPGEPDYDETGSLAGLVAPHAVRAAAQRPLFVSSFNPSTLAAFGACETGVALGFLHGQGLRAPSGLDLARDLGAAVLCSNTAAPALDAALVDAAHAAGLEVMVWTVDEVDRARELAKLGVDAVCTNDPTALAGAL
jgi:glycerophosphoryl diester phosphodiesterase